MNKIISESKEIKKEKLMGLTWFFSPFDTQFFSWNEIPGQPTPPILVSFPINKMVWKLELSRDGNL